jgi:hypothetical protein
MTFPIAVIEHMITNFDPSKVKIEKGSVTLVTSGLAAAASFDNLLMYKENKSCDIIIFCSIEKRFRSDYLNFVENVSIPSSDEQYRNKTDHLDNLAVVLCTYLMHGSIAGLAATPTLVPKFALEVTKKKAEDYALSKLCSVVAFSGSKFPGVFERWNQISEVLPATFKSRLALGLAGNRVRTILRLVLSRVGNQAFVGSGLEVFLAPEFLNGTSLISLHHETIETRLDEDHIIHIIHC